MGGTHVLSPMSSSEHLTSIETLRLKTICGEHCVDFQAVSALAAALPNGGGAGVVRVSFQEVGALSTAFASALLTTLEDWKRGGDGRKVVLCDLSLRHQRVIELCRTALQASAASSGHDPGSAPQPTR